MNVTSLPLLFVCLFSGGVFAQHNFIDEEKFIPLGGIEQWITIKGNDIQKPVILFLHGGPGSVMTPYSEAIYGAWADEFILVNWDQRGAGRTFGRNLTGETDETFWAENPLNIEQMVADGIELTGYLLQHLKQQEIILIGTSWGSILGTKMALSRPDLYYAYLGHSQFVNFNKNLQNAYHKVYELAESSGEDEVIGNLDALGEPPYKSAKDIGQLLRIVRNFERNNALAAPEYWWQAASGYDTEEDRKNRYTGDDYSFIHFAGHDALGIKSMVSDIDFSKDGLEFELPVYFVQGENDILTASEINKPYFDNISAPEKDYILVPGAGHGLNKSITDTQYWILMEKLKY